ncbi:MAG: hypothetical protein Q9M43_04805 [Sulfurimonas sp.]|nr:hypothetical protein [Sulfurimonas sp.]
MKIIFYIMCIVAITHLNAAATNEQRTTFEKDCKAGQSISCHNMGLMHASGDGVKKDDSKALEFFTKACDKNYYESCSKAAVLYEESSTIKQDSKKSSCPLLKSLWRKRCLCLS